MKQPPLSEILPLLESATAAARASDPSLASLSLARAAALLATRTLDTIDRLLVRQPLARLRAIATPVLAPALEHVERIAR